MRREPERLKIGSRLIVPRHSRDFPEANRRYAVVFFVRQRAPSADVIEAFVPGSPEIFPVARRRLLCFRIVGSDTVCGIILICPPLVRRFKKYAGAKLAGA